MTRFLPLLLAAILTATPGLAGGMVFGLPNLTYPDTAAPVTRSTSGPAVPAPANPRR